MPKLVKSKLSDNTVRTKLQVVIKSAITDDHAWQGCAIALLPLTVNSTLFLDFRRGLISCVENHALPAVTMKQPLCFSSSFVGFVVLLPSVHNSVPFTASAAEKYSVPLTSVRFSGFESPIPGLMSLTITVPADVPSDFHSSVPFTASAAEKYSVPLTSVRNWGFEEPAKLMFLTITVPADVPSDFHNSVPFTASVAEKYSVPLTSVRNWGFEEPAKLMFLTITVP